MRKVIFRPYKPLPNQMDIIEYTDASLDAIKLRALALNWYIVKITEIDIYS